MQSLKELYKIGPGPSSSHTVAPRRACLLYMQEFGLMDYIDIELYGSLSLTGKGHGTDQIIIDTFSPIKTNVSFKLDWNEKFPNGFYIIGHKGNKIYKWTVFSIGGGSIQIKEKNLDYNDEVYLESSFNEIHEKCKVQNISLVEYVNNYEPNLDDHLYSCLEAMLNCVNRGLNTTGMLKGKLNVERSSKALYAKALEANDDNIRNKLKLMSYAYAANEENADGKEVVTSPTLGACGVMASLCYYFYNDLHFSKEKIIDGLKVAGIFGNVIKQNASVSGAVGGCQAEVGTACSMGAAFCSFMYDLSIEEIEYASEIGIEHHLGLTCDPVGGYVIIPCIERNAMAALRAFDAYVLASNMLKIKNNKVSFDMVVNTMKFTGNKIAVELRETALGGLASEFDIEGM